MEVHLLAEYGKERNEGMNEMQAGARRFRFNDLPRERVADHLSRAAIRSADSLAVLNWMEPRPSARPPHSHPFDQLSFVLEGEMEFLVTDQTFRVGPGEVLLISPDTDHTARAVGSEVALSLDMFSPPRPDYLHLADHQRPNVPGGADR